MALLMHFGRAVWTETWWNGIFAVWLVFVFLLSGIASPNSLLQQFISFSAVLLILLGVWRLRNGFPTGAAFFATVLGALALFLVLLQLAPVPYEIWRGLPGRELMVKSIEALGAAPASMTFSLSPHATREAATSLLPPLAAFICVLSIHRPQFWWVGAAIAFTALVGFGLGLLQEGLGTASGLFFHGETSIHPGPSGTFANKNFFAAQLYSSVPFIAALAMFMARKWAIRPLILLIFTALWVGLLVMVLAAVGSRAGIILAMLAVMLTFSVVFRPSEKGRFRFNASRGILFSIVALVAIAQTSLIGILQLAETDPVNDLRLIINKTSLLAASTHFPAGTGFGTFVPIYQLYETPNIILANFVNHAHNDWLEMAVEGGLPAVILVVLFLIWLSYTFFHALRLESQDPGNAHVKAAGVAAVMLLLHSAVDYPLRTIALGVLFGLCLGLLSRSTERPGPAQRDVSVRPRPRPLAGPKKAAWTPRPSSSRAVDGARERLHPVNPAAHGRPLRAQ
jgi:O-antigen ligase